MDPLLVVSPHLDDAVLSMGQVLAGRPDAVVATVFAGEPTARYALTTYDRDCGFQNAGGAIRARHREDDRAMHLLAATPVRFPFLDFQYRELAMTGPADYSDEDAAARLYDVAASLSAEPELLVVGPLGLKHPDHHATRRAVNIFAKAAAASGRAVQLWCYEDAPSRVLWPEEVPDALAWWRGMGWDPAGPAFMGTGPLDVKEAAVGCYRSQLWALDMHAVLCPERLWRLWPT